MAIAKNVTRGESVIRIILGIILIALGLSLTGLWKPIFILVGAILILTAFVGY